MTTFLKMHGLGNDFAIFDARIFPLPVDPIMAKAIADRKLEGLSMGTPNGIPLAGMNRELAMAMKRAGWREVMIAPETGS